jgi:ligand-binding SRPBCC domain-containing protein
MPVIEIEIEINAPIERVFDLARCIDLHEETMSKTNEKAIGGVTKGLIGLGETVTWQATHFGIRQKLTSKIAACRRPFHFRDVMVKGAFKSFTHDHFFEQKGEKILMKDVFDYSSPLWILGKIADALFLENYMKKLLSERNLLIKKIAESADWRKFLA